MPAQPAYITQNRHGTFYFRIVVPLPVRSALGLQREIRRSLKTDSQRLAIRRARQYAARFDAVFDKVLSVVDRDDYIPTEEDLLLFNEEIERAGQADSWGSWASGPSEPTQPFKSALPDDEWRKLDEQQRWDAIAALLNGEASRGIQDHQRETAERLYAKGRALPFVKFSRRLPQMLYEADMATHGSSLAAATERTAAKPQPDGPTLFELWEQHWGALAKVAQVTNGDMKAERTRKAERAHACRLNILSGNRPINRLALDDFNRIYLQIFEIKVSRGKKLPPPDSPIEAILAQPGEPRIEAASADKLIIRLGVLHKFAYEQGMTTVSPASICKPKVDLSSPDTLLEEKSFTPEDLKAIFEGWIYTGTEVDHRQKVYPYQFWLPILGFYTGGRLNELCQLDTEDVKEIKGIWTIAIVDDPKDRPCPKSVKNKSSRRILPLHSELIRIGFLDFHKQAVSEGREKLFSDGLVYSVDKGWGGIASQFFCRMPSGSTPAGGYFHKVGIRSRDENGKTDNKNFHTFRHTFTDIAREAGADSYLVLPELTGHSRRKEGQLPGYGNGFSLAKRREVMEGLPMPVDLSHIIYADFERRLGPYIDKWTQLHRAEHGLNQSEETA